MRDGDALRPACRARCVDDEGRRTGIERERSGWCRDCVDGGEIDDFAADPAGRRQGRARREKQTGFGILDDGAQTVAGPFWIEQHRDGARLHAAEQADDEVGRALDDERHRRLVRHAAREEHGRESVGQRVQLGVGEASIRVDERERVGRPQDGRVKKIEEGRGGEIRRLGRDRPAALLGEIESVQRALGTLRPLGRENRRTAPRGARS